VSGKLRLAMCSAELGPIVEAAVESMRPAADAKGVRLELRHSTEEARVSGDPDRLQQVVWNMVSNAIKFTDPGGQVEVDVVREGGFVTIRVRDNGRGISQQLLPHVFDRFWQADTTTTRRHGGLGLGLSIVRHLVELHGGTVAVESDGPGHGATFSVRLPAVTASLRAAEQPAGARLAPRTRDGIRVLVVDDEVDAQEVVRRVLELSGVEVRTAANTTEALAILEDWAPTVLVSDIAMPEEDGYAFIRRLRVREAAQGGHVPALAFSALARAEDRSRALAAGFDGYVVKPIDPAEFVDAVVAAAAGPDA
jgi:CheY-like chemotaxis protein/anti-sigma regulatory factor (Ser/Thr protein kinase)